MKKKTMKEIVGVVKAIKYIESLDDNTTVISHTVNGMFHYIITEYEELPERKESEFNMYMKERINQWCTKHNVIYDPKGHSFITVEDLVHDFNMWNRSTISSQTFVPLFEEVGARVGNYPEKTTCSMLGTEYLGFKGITINGNSSKDFL